MSQPDIVRGTYIDILLGDGATPEVFTPVCGITTRQFTSQINTNDSFIPDCDDPEDVPIRRLIPTGRQWDLSGDGLYNLAQEAILRSAEGVTLNYRFRIRRPAGSIVGTGYYEGPGMLTQRQIGGNSGNGEFGSISLAIASDGTWVWVPAT